MFLTADRSLKPQPLLALSALSLIALILLWRSIGRYSLDEIAYLQVAGLAVAPGLVAIFYGTIRKDERVAAMTSCLSFLIVFAPCCAILTYFSLGHGLPMHDDDLAHIDMALGFNWPAYATFSAHHPWFNVLCAYTYRVSLWQTLLLLGLLGFNARDPAEIYKLTMAYSLAGLATIILWRLFPTFGATTIYSLPDAVEALINPVVSKSYTASIMALYKSGALMVTPNEFRGIVGFPSFHTADAVISTWYSRRTKALIPLLTFNACVLLACPTQGGHFLIDIIGGVIVSACAIRICSNLKMR